MTPEETRQRTRRLRNVPVAVTAAKLGLLMYGDKWRSADGRVGIRVTEDNGFRSVLSPASGTGSIDLAMHVTGLSFAKAAELVHSHWRDAEPPQYERPSAAEAARMTTEALRQLPLDAVATKLGLVYMGHDRQWHAEGYGIAIDVGRGVFRDFKSAEESGASGGALDLVMHVRGCDFAAAKAWLIAAFGDTPPPIVPPVQRAAEPPPPPEPIEIPDHPGRYARVKDYLTRVRGIDAAVVDLLRQQGTLVADERSNAVFLGKDDAGRVMVAEKRGSSVGSSFHQTVGSKDFCVSLLFVKPRRIVLLECGIDLASSVALKLRSTGAMPEDTLFVSTAGARPTIPVSLVGAIQQAEDVVVAFDADVPGDKAADKLIAAVGGKARRAAPPLHDWNDVLRAANTRRAETRAAATPGIGRDCRQEQAAGMRM